MLTAPGRGAPPDWRGALRVAVAAMATVVLVNLPFALAGYEGWRASFTFQELRKVDITTNSIWYWGFRPWSEPANLEFQAVVDRLSPVLVLASFTVALAVGWPAGAVTVTGFAPLYVEPTTTSMTLPSSGAASSVAPGMAAATVRAESALVGP